MAIARYVAPTTALDWHAPFTDYGKPMTIGDAVKALNEGDAALVELDRLKRDDFTDERLRKQLAQEREQWAAAWYDAADFDLCKELAEGKDIAPPTGSVSGRLRDEIERLRAELAAKALPTGHVPSGHVVCTAVSPHHGDVCDGGRVQSPNAQFTRECEVCHGKGYVPRAEPVVWHEAKDECGNSEWYANGALQFWRVVRENKLTWAKEGVDNYFDDDHLAEAKAAVEAALAPRPFPTVAETKAVVEKALRQPDPSKNVA